MPGPRVRRFLLLMALGAVLTLLIALLQDDSDAVSGSTSRLSVIRAN